MENYSRVHNFVNRHMCATSFPECHLELRYFELRLAMTWFQNAFGKNAIPTKNIAFCVPTRLKSRPSDTDTCFKSKTTWFCIMSLILERSSYTATIWGTRVSRKFFLHYIVNWKYKTFSVSEIMYSNAFQLSTLTQFQIKNIYILSRCIFFSIFYNPATMSPTMCWILRKKTHPDSNWGQWMLLLGTTIFLYSDDESLSIRIICPQQFPPYWNLAVSHRSSSTSKYHRLRLVHRKLINRCSLDSVQPAWQWKNDWKPRAKNAIEVPYTDIRIQWLETCWNEIRYAIMYAKDNVDMLQSDLW